MDADIVIIGCGPTGVAAANFLGARGVRTIVLERYKDIYARARAVTVSDWTMRCFQSAGLAEKVLRDLDVMQTLRWVTYDGREINRLTFPPGTLGYNRSYSIYQPAMEQTLRDGLQRYADHIDVRFGLEAGDIAQDEDGVVVAATNGATGDTAKIRARYALACDGGSSAMRERLGIPLIGDTLATQWVVIDAFVKRWWPNRHFLTFWSDKVRPVVDIPLALGAHRWELPLAPHETAEQFRTQEQLWPLLESMGVTRDDVDIHQHAFYFHHVRRAERWRDRRVFLLGDAAHMMPPWAGQGMQSGVRDAHNLAWKLDAVLSGRASADLLDSYEIERLPDVEKYTMISVGLGRIIKQELTPEEMAALQPPPGAEQPPQPLIEPPELVAGWLRGSGGAVGQMIPQPRVVDARGRWGRLDDLIGDGFTLLGDGLDPLSLLTPEQKKGWDKLGASYRALRTANERSDHAGDLIDVEGGLVGWIRRHGARVVALRPDRFVAATDAGGLSAPNTH